MLSLNHILKFGTTALAAFVLSACGSSGGGSDNQDSSPVNNRELNQSNTRCIIAIDCSTTKGTIIINKCSTCFLIGLLLNYIVINKSI